MGHGDASNQGALDGRVGTTSVRSLRQLGNRNVRGTDRAPHRGRDAQRLDPDGCADAGRRNARGREFPIRGIVQVRVRSGDTTGHPLPSRGV